MNLKKFLLVAGIIGMMSIGCKNETKSEAKTPAQKEQVAVTAKVEEANFAISGMTCEIGCAKTIASKLSKKEGVLEAKVVFEDSTAIVKYDANKLDKKEIIAFIDGIADGKTYKSSALAKSACQSDCEKACCEKGASKKACKEACKKACQDKSKEHKTTACVDSCKEACCKDGDKTAQACKEACKKDCQDKTEEHRATACVDSCEEVCCTKDA